MLDVHHAAQLGKEAKDTDLDFKLETEVSKKGDKGMILITGETDSITTFLAKQQVMKTIEAFKNGT